MQIENKKILKYLIKKWKDDFTGTSALDNSEHFQISHAHVLRLLKGMREAGSIEIRKTKLGKLSKYMTSTSDVD